MKYYLVGNKFQAFNVDICNRQTYYNIIDNRNNNIRIGGSIWYVIHLVSLVS